jgi:lysophospholipase L1-like esterase
LRFYEDVVALHPSGMHLMAGTNDIAQNTGPISDEDILSNIRAMIELAKANHIREAGQHLADGQGFLEAEHQPACESGFAE